MKKALLFLNDPKAAPLFVTLTRLKKSGTTTWISSEPMWRRTHHFVNWSNA